MRCESCAGTGRTFRDDDRTARHNFVAIPPECPVCLGWGRICDFCGNPPQFCTGTEYFDDCDDPEPSTEPGYLRYIEWSGKKKEEEQDKPRQVSSMPVAFAGEDFVMDLRPVLEKGKTDVIGDRDSTTSLISQMRALYQLGLQSGHTLAADEIRKQYLGGQADGHEA